MINSKSRNVKKICFQLIFCLSLYIQATYMYISTSVSTMYISTSILTNQLAKNISLSRLTLFR